MLSLLKENGYPMSIKIDTQVYEEVMEDNETWKGFESTVLDENDEVILSFTHGDFRGRINWYEGFFDGLEYNKNKE